VTRPLRVAPDPAPQDLDALTGNYDQQLAAPRDLLAALDALASKYDRHRSCGWDHIKVGALDQVIDAYRTFLETTP